jgi:hypothetical protein
MFERRRWWRERGLPELRTMALEHWDPLNVYDDADRASSYDLYLERVGRMLGRGKGQQELADYLGAVRTKVYRLDENEIVDEDFAARISAWYQLEAPS